MKAGKIGILTGGGDVPGLNSVIKTVVYRGSEVGRKVTGIRRGWEGLTHVNFDDPASVNRYIIPLDRVNTRTIDRTGGTWLHSSRTNPLKMKKVPSFLTGVNFPASQNTKGGVTSTVYDMTSQVLRNIEKLELDYLVAIGGDDTLSYAAHLDRQGSRSSRFLKRWTMTFGIRSIALAFRPPSPVRATQSSASAPQSHRTSVSGSSAFSAAMPDIRHCIRLTRAPCAAASRNTKSISTSSSI